MYLVVVIMQDIKLIPDLIRAWQKIGVPGGTILNSAGLYQTSGWLSRLGLNALDRIFDSDANTQRTLLVAVENDDLLEKVTAEAEQVVGSFQRPHSGLLFVLPIISAKGMVKLKPRAATSESPPAELPHWKVRRDTLISEIPQFLIQRPTIVDESMLLDAVAKEMTANPNTHLACVINAENHLVGVLDFQTLADDLFFYIFPEDFLSKLTDLDDLMDFAQKSKLRSAGDAMQKPVWIKQDETVKDALQRMHTKQLPGLPVISDRYQISGYINLLSLLAYCLEDKEETV